MQTAALPGLRCRRMWPTEFANKLPFLNIADLPSSPAWTI